MGSGKIRVAVPLVALLALLPVDGGAFVDDFESDFWLPFTHFNLGDRAAAGYASGLARSGERSYRIAIHGWTLRDFGSAYGYALYETGGGSISRIRVSVLHASLADSAPSPGDAFAAGIALQLLDVDHRSLGTYRYLTGLRASLNGGRCGPTGSDLLLDRDPAVGTWVDIGRDPSADFPGAPWASAAFVKVSIGFLCAAGLTGASYVLHFDDFALQAGAGDADGDGLEDLEEDTRRIVTEIAWGGLPALLASGNETVLEVLGPRVGGVGHVGALRIDLEHGQTDDLSVTLDTFDGVAQTSRLLWDPGVHARGIAILEPTEGRSVRGDLLVAGRTSGMVAGSSVELYLDEVLLGTAESTEAGTFSLLLATDDIREGLHTIRAQTVVAGEDGEPVTRRARVSILVDRTSPDLALDSPADGSVLRGLAIIEAQAYDAHGLEAVSLSIDGSVVDRRDTEPYVFAYDTLDLVNGEHGIEVRAVDAAGNAAARTVDVTVVNDVPVVLPPCLPTCRLVSETTVGNLAPPSALAETKVFTLLGGTVRVTEVLQVPWSPRVAEVGSGVSLVLDLLRDPRLPERDGVVGTNLTTADLATITGWRLTVRDHGSGQAGRVTGASVFLASRLSSDSPDTDGDSLPDAVERGSQTTSPVLADGDADGLGDAFELEAHEIGFTIERIPLVRTVLTDPAIADFDGDGLSDGAELLGLPDHARTDPTDRDTDDDTLSDGEERLVHLSDPTLRDTDEDALRDDHEVRPRPFGLVVNEVPRLWTLTTSPILSDTDDDGLGDGEEELGLPDGIATHPDLADTDEDGLNDSEERRIGADGFTTRPLHADSDRDGVWDTFDKLPHRIAEMDWETVYPVGLVRFDQEFDVFWIEGIHARIIRKLPDLETGGVQCLELGDDVAGSTKSSNVTREGIVDTINDVFAKAGETRYEATRATRDTDGASAFSTFLETVGSCPEDDVQYDFEYRLHQTGYVTSFQNVENVTIVDDEGRPFHYAFVPVPVDAGESSSVILQFSLPPEEDRSFFVDYRSWLAPAFTYVVFGGPDFTKTAILHRGTSFGTELNEFAYRLELRIPADVLNRKAIDIVDGVPTIGLYLSPSWVGRDRGVPIRDALNTSAMRIASISTEKPTQVYSLIIRLAREDQDLLFAQADALASQPMGLHDVGTATVYVFRARTGVTVDPSILAAADAILLVADSESDLFAVRDSVDWGDPGIWFEEIRDPWGQAIKAFKESVRIVRVAVAVGIFAELLQYRYAEPGSYLVQADPDSIILLEKGEHGGISIFTVSVVESEELLLIDVVVSGEVVVRRQLLVEVTRSEILTDPASSKILNERYAVVRGVLRGLSIGAVLATNGREAVIAFSEGDTLKGLVYTTNAAVGVLGVLKGEVSLASVIGLRSSKFRALRLGTLATAASGSLLAGYELFLGTHAPDEIAKRAHFERSVSHAIDSGLSLVPVYGTAVLMSWSLTTLALSSILPNPLAARITATPGTLVVFLFEYFLSGTIPAAVAEEVLAHASDTMLLLMSSNIVIRGIPSIPILP